MKRTTLAALGVAAFLTSSTQVAFAAKSPQEFIKDAIQGDNSEIMLGQLAQQKGGEKVKTFGQTLVTDHTLAKQQAGDVAKTLGVAPPSDPMTEAKDEESKLSRMSGKDFDREFAAYMVTDHKKDIAEFQDQASADNGSASALAAKQIPVLKQHLQMAEAMATSGSASTSSSQTMASALAQEGPDMWRASKLSGVNVYGPNNQKVGGVTDVLMGKDGKAEYIPESVSNIERGRQLPTIETLVDLVRVLEVPPPDFLDGLDGGSGLSRERVGHARLRAASPPAGGEHHVDAFAAPHPDAAQRPDLLAPAEGFLDPLADPLADGIARVARGPLVNGGVTAGQGDCISAGCDEA